MGKMARIIKLNKNEKRSNPKGQNFSIIIKDQNLLYSKNSKICFFKKFFNHKFHPILYYNNNNKKFMCKNKTKNRKMVS